MRHLRHRFIATLSAVITSTMLMAAEAPAKIVIWKLDDLKAGEKARLVPGFKRVADWADDNKTVVTMGIICESLSNPNADDVAWLKKHAIENGGRIEFWLHGWDHKAWEEKGVKISEFKGTPIEHQAKHLKDSCELFTKVTGLTFHVFGAPYNQIDEHTPAAMDVVPELTFWMYGPKSETQRRVIPRSINMEIATGKVSYDAFMKEYKAKPQLGPMLIQGHCGMWDDKSFDAFTKVAAFLAKEGWMTKTCAQAYGK